MVVVVAAITVGLVWFGQVAGLLSEPHPAALIDVGTGVAALGISLGWLASR
jgi:hypothetical protein